MEKKQYKSPTMRIRTLHVHHMLATSVRGVSGNADVKYGGASSNNEGGEVRSNGHRSIWDSMSGE